MGAIDPQQLPVFDDLLDAAARIEGWAVRTPLLESAELNRRVGGRVLLKAEVLQRTGSFKFRGAYNRISRIPEEERAGGVVAFSSGNHAQGVAAAAQLLGLPATIIMPTDAPAIKLANTRALGARVVRYDRNGEDREAIAAAVQAETGATLVRPFDDRYVIAGQGTAGLELAEQARALGAVPDAVLSCCGGGGLTAGIALAVHRLLPGTEIFSVEPQAFDDTARSLVAGERRSNNPGAVSICDALLTPTPGNLTFPINRALLAGGLAVSDEEALHAMAFALRVLKLVIEPGGAVCLAALLSGRFDARDRVVALTLSGGNADDEMLVQALKAFPAGG